MCSAEHAQRSPKKVPEMFVDFFGIKDTFKFSHPCHDIIITWFEITLTRIKIQISRLKGGIKD